MKFKILFFLVVLNLAFLAIHQWKKYKINNIKIPLETTINEFNENYYVGIYNLFGYNKLFMTKVVHLDYKLSSKLDYCYGFNSKKMKSCFLNKVNTSSKSEEIFYDSMSETKGESLSITLNDSLLHSHVLTSLSFDNYQREVDISFGYLSKKYIKNNNIDRLECALNHETLGDNSIQVYYFVVN